MVSCNKVRFSSATNVVMAWQLAKRYYQTGAKSRYVQFINRASRIGFTIGVAALIVGLSVMNGFERELRNTLLSVIPDIEFKSVLGTLSDWTETAKQVQSDNRVTGVAPYIELNAMIQKQNQMEAVLLKGVSPRLESSVNITPEYIKSGNWLVDQNLEPNTLPDAVIGAGLAKKLELSIGDRLEILVPTVSDTGRLATPKYMNFKISGIYQVGGQMDYGQVYVPLSVLQKSQGYGVKQAHGIKASIVNPFVANMVAMEVGRNVTEYVYVIDWFRSQGHVYNDIVLVKDIMYLVMVLVMAVASFNIISSLSMAIQEKYSDIGILKTLGLTPQTVKCTFVLMGLLTAVRGILVGVIVGCLIAYFLPDLFLILETLLKVKVLDGDVYFIEHLPSELSLWQISFITLTAITIAFLASLYPASKAAKLSPIELLS